MEPAGPARVERRLAAILAADVAGYSRLIEADEEGTLGRLKALRAEIIDPKIAHHKGRIVKTTGDGLLVEFASVVDALRCAAEMQAALAEGNAALPPDRRIEFRIGINMGDIVVEDGDIFGDGVNVAARLEGLAEPGGICISARVQEDAAGRLDLVFEDMGEQALKNIARPVRAYRVLGAASAAATRTSPGLALPDKPSIAVLPFANMSSDPEQEYFADGMVEEIITALSRIRWLFVIARNSSFAYKGQAVDVKRIGRELGVRYVLESSVRKAGGRVRITAQLIDAPSGAHLWADRFDGSLEDIFDLQDKVASSVAGVIEPAVQAAEVARSADRPTTDLTAYDLYLRALPHCRSWERERVHSALELLDQAIERDPSFGPALALAAMCHHHFDRLGGAQDPDLHHRAAVDYARRAVRAAPDDPTTIGNAAGVLGSFGGDINPAIALADRALALNPSFAGGWRMSGWLRLWAGDLDVAIEHFETAFRLSPRERDGAHRIGVGEA
jgi:TolB-like protein